MDNWLDPPQHEIPLVFGPSSTTLGYYALEEAGRANAQETLNYHQREAQLWYRALTLHLEAQRGKWPPLGDLPEPLSSARKAQIDLLALSLCSSKAALDMILAGYYSIGWAAIRHCAEVVIHCHYLAHFPSTYRLYYAREDEGEDPPRCFQMVEQIKKHHKNDHSQRTRAYVDTLEKSYQLWRFMSAGSHPTGQGLTQLQDPDEPDSRYWGSNYRYDLTMVSFDNGLAAVDFVLSCYSVVRSLDLGWSEACAQWQRDLYAWRDELRTNQRVAHLSTKSVSDPTD